MLVVRRYSSLMLNITKECNLRKEGLVGQQELKKRLSDSFDGDRLLNHAFLFCADEGMGKKAFAHEFAELILCQDKQGDGKPCGQCASCHYIAAGTHPDFKWIQKDNDKIIKVDRIRKEIISDLQMRPQLGEYKVYLINLDDVNEQGQNALLKSLEEPPQYAVFLLTTTLLDNLLDTIISRVMVLNLQRYSESEMKEIFRLKGNNEAENFAIIYANGNPGKALQISGDENFKELRNEAIEIFFSMPTTNRTTLLIEKLEYLKKVKDQIDIILNVWQDLIHDVLLLMKDENLQEIHQNDLFNRVKRLSDYYRNENKETRYQQLLNAFDAISDVRKANQVNVSFDGMIGQLLLSMRKDLTING